MRISKKKIGIDMDCTICDTNNELIDLYNYYTGENLQLEDITEWDFLNIATIKHKNLIFDLFYNNKLWNSIKPIKDSQHYMRLLNNEYEIYIVTATYPQNAKIKIEWLLKHYPFLNEKNVIISHNKQIINVDLLVDDFEGNLINGHYSKILLDYPWNRNINDKEHGILRVHNWKEVYKAVNTLLPID